jgi:hypothetical protein
MACMKNCSITDEAAKTAVQWQTKGPQRPYPRPNQNLVGDRLHKGPKKWGACRAMLFNTRAVAKTTFKNLHTSSCFVECQISNHDTTNLFRSHAVSDSVRLYCVGHWSIISAASTPCSCLFAFRVACIWSPRRIQSCPSRLNSLHRLA